MYRYFFLVIVTILLQCCASGTEEKTGVESIMELDKGGDFRGNAMGDDVQQVLAREERNIIYNMPDEITCRIPMDMVDSTYYEVNYSFDEGELNHIQLNLFPRNTNDLHRLQKDFSSYYESIYKSFGQNQSRQWKTRSARGKDVFIRITDRSEKMNKLCLSIYFKEEK